MLNIGSCKTRGTSPNHAKKDNHPPCHIITILSSILELEEYKLKKFTCYAQDLVTWEEQVLDMQGNSKFPTKCEVNRVEEKGTHVSVHKH